MDLQQIFNGKNITESSKRTYISNLVKLNDGKPITNLNFLKSPDIILEKLKPYKDTTKRNYIVSIVTLLSSIPNRNKQIDKLFNSYTTIMKQFNSNLKDRTDKTDTEKANWISKNDISLIYNNYSKGISSFLNKKKLNNIEYNILLDYVILSLYTLIPPRRIVDYNDMYVVKGSILPDANNKNYLICKNQQFIFNKYKTAGTYGTQIIDIPENLMDVLRLYIKHNPGFKNNCFKLIVKYDGEYPVNNFITRRLNCIFNKNVSVNMLRKVYLTSKYSNKETELETDAKAMGTSVSTAQSNYIKNE